MLFVIDTTLPRMNQFRTVFDDMNISRIELVMTFQINEKFKFDAVGQLFSYQTDVLPYAWNLPNYVIKFRGHYNLFDKFITNLDLSFLGGRRMQEFAPGDGIGMTNLVYHSEMGLLADVNLSFEYRYNHRISAFIQFNNLAAQQYLRWMNSPVFRFQALGGVTFRF
jgi:outer membrane receptor protein involved in Fe transport